jgi:hypothetical protein
LVLDDRIDLAVFLVTVVKEFLIETKKNLQGLYCKLQRDFKLNQYSLQDNGPKCPVNWRVSIGNCDHHQCTWSCDKYQRYITNISD